MHKQQIFEQNYKKLKEQKRILELNTVFYEKVSKPFTIWTQPKKSSNPQSVFRLAMAANKSVKEVKELLEANGIFANDDSIIEYKYIKAIGLGYLTSQI